MPADNSINAELLLNADPFILFLLLSVLAFGVILGWGIAAERSHRRMIKLKQRIKDEREYNRERHALMQQSFTALSGEALQNNNRAFLSLAQQVFGRLQDQAKNQLDLKENSINSLIDPIKQVLSKTEQQLNKLNKDHIESEAALRQQLKQLTRSQDHLQGETRNLVQALRRPEVRGQWGELTLRRLVELAGMVKHCDFDEQVHMASPIKSDDTKLRPDMLVHMPANRIVVVDVKTPLDAYLSAVESNTDLDRDRFLKQHARNVRNRVKELAAKDYWSQFDDSLDFVVLFIPGDQFLSSALDLDRKLLEDALSQRVILSTPTSLVALLRAIAYGWRQQTLNDNAEQIRTIGEDLMQRLATLSDHLSKLGRSLDSSVENYNRLIGSYEGSVLPGAKKFGELGIQSRKSAPATASIDKSVRKPISQSKP